MVVLIIVELAVGIFSVLLQEKVLFIMLVKGRKGNFVFSRQLYIVQVLSFFMSILTFFYSLAFRRARGSGFGRLL